MTDLTFLLPPVLAFVIAAGAPGPATLSVAATAMSRGRRAALMLGAGLGLGLAFWGVVVAAGLGTVILAWAPALLALRIAGAAVLLWLAWKSARSAFSAAGADAVPVPGGALFRRGLLINALNPKAILAWGAVIAVGLRDDAGPAQLIAITTCCALIGWLLYFAYAALFSTDRVMAAYRRARRWIDGACAVLFGAAGLRLLTWKVTP